MPIQGAGKSSTQTDIANLTGLRSRNPIFPQLAANPLMDKKNWQPEWIQGEEKHGTRIVSTAGQPSERGAVLDSDIVDINENFTNCINSNHKVVE